MILKKGKHAPTYSHVRSYSVFLTILAAGVAFAQTSPSALTLDYWIDYGVIPPDSLRVEEVNKTFTQISELKIQHVGTATSLAISGYVEFRSPTSMVRIILEDTDSNEYLVYDTYPLAESDTNFGFARACRETCVSQGITVELLKIELIDASLRIDQLTAGSAATASNQNLLKWQAATGEQVRALQNLEIIETLNANIRKKGLRWKAGETEISSLSYAEKKRLLAKGEPTLPNLQGFDYYVGGIYELLAPGDSTSIYPAGESSFVDTFDWRSRHGANDSESPYFDGDPAGSGWITPVKRQQCANCWAHCAVGAVEAQANLYFNQHLDLDLSEQHIVSCGDCGTCADGGSPSCALRFIWDQGVMDEACFPESGTDEPCANQCPVPGEQIRIGYYHWIDSSKDEEVKRQLIKYGPTTFGIVSWWHCMVLVGYQVDTDHSTIWIVKNSWGTSWGEDGYGYLKVPSDDRYLFYAVENPIFSDIRSYDVACYDHDGDGYANWGIGAQIPVTCPSASSEKDCDDSDPRLGPFQEDGGCRPLDQPPPTIVRMEAEDMQLDTYRVEALDFASGGALINLKGPGYVGNATTAFPGASGKYDILLAYHDENDGLAQLSVTVGGATVDSWTLDLKSSESQPKVANRVIRQIATEYAINNGDEIRIDGLQGNWDHANVDYIEFVLRQKPTPVRFEAEDMQLDTYSVETLNFASGGALINLRGPGINGSAATVFTGGNGRYDIFLVYHDENDGEALLTVSLAGVSLDSWILDQRIPGGAQPQEFNRFTRQVAKDHMVSTGDEIRIDGVQGNWDIANVDYIEFVPTQPPDSVRIEAENMQLDTYGIESLDFASNGALINLKGPGLSGSATTAFPGNSGNYDINVVYHDENDGLAQLSVSIDGTTVDSWTLDLKSSEAQPKPANRLTRQIATGYTVENGDEIRIDGIQGNWDHANVDYVEFVSAP